MKLDNMVMFRLSVFDDDWYELAKKLYPDNCTNSAWIPQTLGDQGWLWLEFANRKDKKKYLDWIKNCEIRGKKKWIDKSGNEQHLIRNTYVKDMLMNGEDWITQKEINYWTN